MTIELDLSPDVEATLLAQAEANGVSLETYISQVLRQKSRASSKTVTGPEERARAFERWARNHPRGAALPPEALRRESLVRTP